MFTLRILSMAEVSSCVFDILSMALKILLRSSNDTYVYTLHICTYICYTSWREYMHTYSAENTIERHGRDVDEGNRLLLSAFLWYLGLLGNSSAPTLMRPHCLQISHPDTTQAPRVQNCKKWEKRETQYTYTYVQLQKYCIL